MEIETRSKRAHSVDFEKWEPVKFTPDSLHMSLTSPTQLTSCSIFLIEWKQKYVSSSV